MLKSSKTAMSKTFISPQYSTQQKNQPRFVTILMKQRPYVTFDLCNVHAAPTFEECGSL